MNAVGGGTSFGATRGACPDLGALERMPMTIDVRDHVDTCPACRLVRAVFDAGTVETADCDRFDALLAAVLAGRPTRQSLGVNGFAVVRNGTLVFAPAGKRTRKFHGRPN